jgi:hypothetical protein
VSNGLSGEVAGFDRPDPTRYKQEGGARTGGVIRRLHKLFVATAAILAFAPLAGCGDDPSTVQLVLRADPGVAEAITAVDVMVTAVITTGMSDVIPCRPCIHRFTAEGGRMAFPIVVDFVRGETQYEKAWFIVTYATAGGPRTLYHSIEFPETGLRSNTRLIQTSCVDHPCAAGEQCLDGDCYPVADLEDEVRAGSWSSRPCSDNCGPAPDGGLDVDDGGGADADAEADTGADTDRAGDDAADADMAG